MHRVHYIALGVAIAMIAMGCGGANRHVVGGVSPGETTEHAARTDSAPSGLKQTPALDGMRDGNLTPVTDAEYAAIAPAPPSYLPYRFIVGFKPDAVGLVADGGATNEAAADLPQSLIYQSPALARLAREIATRYGVALVEEAYYGAVNFAAYETPDGGDAGLVMARIAADCAEAVAYIEYDGVLSAQYTPNDPYYPDGLWGLVKINADDAWDTQQGDSGVLVAIIDSGVRYSGDTTGDAPDHEDLAAVCLHPPDFWPSETFDLYDNDNVPEDEMAIGHGTRVAGIAAAAGDNSKGVVGLGFGVSIVPIRVTDANGQAETSTVGVAVTLASAIGADIANISISGSGNTTLKDACDQAYENGLLLVAAAGNDDVSGPYYPGSYDSVLNVGATDKDDNRASFSNYGVSIDIAAPGLDVNSTTNSSTTAYNNDWGTSYSAPLVAGAAALLLSYDDTVSPAELRNALINTGPLLPAGQWGKDDVRRLDIDAALDWIIDQPPAISILSPADGANVAGSVSFTVQVTDNTAVALTELYVDGVLKAGFDSGGTHTYMWATTDYHGGPHALSVYAEDDAGTHSAQAIAVTVMNQQPSAVNPPSAERGDSVVVQGSYFIGDAGDSFNPFTDQLHFTTGTLWVRALVSDWQQTAITATVPAQALIGPVMISIDGGERVSAFDFWLRPSIDALDPDVQVAGGQVTITGNDFGDAPGDQGTVAIGSVEATPILWSYDEITIAVPPGVAQADLTVTTTGGTSNGVQFTPEPRITLVHPWPAWLGAEVAITGTSFGATQGLSALEFGGGALASGADIVSWTDTLITATVPLTAESGAVVVTVNAVASDGYNLRLSLPPPGIVDVGQL